MKLLLPLAALLFFSFDDGCDQSSQKSQTAAPQKSETHSRPIGRFEKLQNFRVDVALDTQTGQLCRTWIWQSTDRVHPDAYENLPVCISLYLQYPPVDKTEKP
jgi:hypothetical protein